MMGFIQTVFSLIAGFILQVTPTQYLLWRKILMSMAWFLQ